MKERATDYFDANGDRPEGIDGPLSERQLMRKPRPDEPIMWKGKRIDDMTREEAIAALKEACCRMRAQSEAHLRNWDTLAAMRSAGA